MESTSRRSRDTASLDVRSVKRYFCAAPLIEQLKTRAQDTNLQLQTGLDAQQAANLGLRVQDGRTHQIEWIRINPLNVGQIKRQHLQ